MVVQPMLNLRRRFYSPDGWIRGGDGLCCQGKRRLSPGNNLTEQFFLCSGTR